MSSKNIINIVSILDAVAKVEKANHIKLTTLKDYLNKMGPSTVEMFKSLSKMDSIDSRFQTIANSSDLDSEETKYVLEASLLI